MGENRIYRLAGFTGLIACLIAIAGLPLRWIGGPLLSGTAFSTLATQANILTIARIRNLMDMVIFILSLFFLAAFRKIVLEKRKDLEWLATSFLAVGFIYITITLITNLISSGTGLNAPSGNINPVILRGMVETAVFILSSLELILLGSMMAFAGVLIGYSKILPAWVGWLSFCIAILSFIFVPAISLGGDTAKFYSPVVVSPFLIWILIASVFMIQRKTEYAVQ
jgi:hypothetical protein